jgi:glycosyltransferase involved in cell wall biosynthesis
VKKHEILYLSYDGMTDPLGQSQVLPYIKGLAKEGYRFSLISFEKPEKLKDNRAYIQQICDDIGIDWYPLVYTKRPPIVSTLFDIRRMKNKAYALHRQKNFSIIHCRSYLSSLVGLSMKKKFGIKFIFDMRGFWADERVDGNLWNLKNPIYKNVFNYFKNKEKAFLENADYSISLTRAGLEEIHSWKHIENNPVPISIIPCCVDLAHFDPLCIKDSEQDNYREKLDIPKDNFILTYLGSIGTWYLLDDMMRFFKTLQEYIPQAKFLFITGDASESIYTSAKKLSISPEFIIIRSATRIEVPILLSLSNYSIFFIKPSYSKKSSSPTKQGEIMAMGIPIICNTGVGDTDRIVKKYNSGLVIENMNESDYKQAIQKIISIPPLSIEHYRKGAHDYFSLEQGNTKYTEIYNKLILQDSYNKNGLENKVK